MYEYSTLPNSWEEQTVEWEHYYSEDNLGGGPHMSTVAFDQMNIGLGKTIEVMAIEAGLQETQLPQEIYEVYLRRHLEVKELPCQLSI